MDIKRSLGQLEEYIKELNETNSYVQFFPKIENGVLLSIDVRFLAPTPEEKYFENDKKWERVKHEITTISRDRLFPVGKELFGKGILELKASYVHRYCDYFAIVNTLEYISEFMIDDIVLP